MVSAYYPKQGTGFHGIVCFGDSCEKVMALHIYQRLMRLLGWCTVIPP
jgi:hypothetical protein